mgnify:CR=1 FL=1
MDLLPVVPLFFAFPSSLPFPSCRLGFWLWRRASVEHLLGVYKKQHCFSSSSSLTLLSLFPSLPLVFVVLFFFFSPRSKAGRKEGRKEGRRKAEESVRRYLLRMGKKQKREERKEDRDDRDDDDEEKRNQSAKVFFFSLSLSLSLFPAVSRVR